MKKLLLVTLTLSLTAFNAQAGNTNNVNHTKFKKNPINQQLRKIIHKLALTGDPSTGREIPAISSDVAQLGMDLFYSKSLGGDQDSACVTCHHPILGGGDDLSLPIGTESDVPDLLGPGRTNDFSANKASFPPVPRNAPTTFNTALWDQVLFHDGRLESLDKIPGANGAGTAGMRTPDSSAIDVADPFAGQNLVQAQARFPVTSREEMKGFQHDSYSNQQIREFLAQRVGGYGNALETDADPLIDTEYWVNKFRMVFDQPNASAEEVVTEQNISFAIGEYERSQVFVNSPWKQYVEGDNHAISKAAKYGAVLFFNSVEDGGANCANCHSGDFFTDESFHNVAAPQIGDGKGDGVDGSKDFGRFRETANEADKFAFRTPSLLNVEVTGPWSHAGAYTSLTAVVKHMTNPQAALDNYDFNQLTQPGISHVELLVENTQEALDAPSFAVMPVAFSDMQIANLVEFLKTLTDPCVKDRECLAAWIPDADVLIDPNDKQLNAVGEDLLPL